MAIDSPLEQAEAMVSTDDRRKAPGALASAAQNLSDLLTKAGPAGEVASAVLSKVLEYGKRQDEENQKYVFSVVVEELKYALKQVGELKDEQQRFMNSEGPRLLTEAAKRASETRDHERLRRLAVIFVHGVQNASAVAVPEAEEFMRLAVLLSETDVLVLREFVKHQAGLENTSKQSGRSLLDTANQVWRNSKPAVEGLREGDLQSSCSRLQAFGLLVRIERVQSALSPDEIPYALLGLGERFAEYIRSYNTDESLL